MKLKAKFKPQVSRVRLNPEQAVLSCSCADGNVRLSYPGCEAGVVGCSGKGYMTVGWFKNEATGATS